MSRIHRLSVAVLAAAAAIGALSGLYVAITPAADQTPLSGRSWADAVAGDPELTSIIERLLVVLGLLGAAFGIAAAVIALVPYRRGERWAWNALWLLPLAYGPIAVRMLTGEYPVGYFYAALAAVAIFGLLLTSGAYGPWANHPREED